MRSKAHYLLETTTTVGFLFYVYDRSINANFSLKDLVETKPFFNRIYDAYKKPVLIDGDLFVPRKYHDFNHIFEGIASIVEIEPECNCLFLNQVILAWFYHDIFYQTGGNHENERLSADYALADLIQQGLCGEYAGRVFDLIMWTKHDKNPPENDYEANLIVDIDFLRLSTTPSEAFDVVTKMIRDEFAISDKEWAVNRIKFWQGLLERKKGRIFRTSHFEHLNPIALKNIESEILILSKQND